MSAFSRRFTAPSHYDFHRTEVVTREPLVTSLNGDAIDHLSPGSEQVVLVNTAEVRRRLGSHTLNCADKLSTGVHLTVDNFCG